jgi:hypothetical protein
MNILCNHQGVIARFTQNCHARAAWSPLYRDGLSAAVLTPSWCRTGRGFAHFFGGADGQMLHIRNIDLLFYLVP